MFSKVFTLLSIIALASSSAIVTRRHNIGIIGGNETSIENYPWQISLQLLGLHNCGGSIISEDTILTAAHCIDIFMGLYRVVAGSSDLSSPQVTLGIRDAVVHEKYNNTDYDVAIIKLSENITFSDTIKPVSLVETVPEDGASVTVSGYGVTTAGGLFPSNLLRAVDVNIVNQAECNSNYAQYGGVTERMLCAAVPEGGKDACQGDSGGPLVDSEGNLVGIVSWGMGCALQGYPGVYTNVASVRQWIVDNAGL